MKPYDSASEIIDLCSEFEIVEDYELEIHENVVLRSKIYLVEGFVNVYRNFETGKVAFAWIKEEKRIYGADNTGSWHVHPYDDPSKHRPSDRVKLRDFLKKIEKILDKDE